MQLHELASFKSLCMEVDMTKIFAHSVSSMETSSRKHYTVHACALVIDDLSLDPLLNILIHQRFQMKPPFG